MSIEIFSHGACGEVTGSKHFLKTSKSLVMIDCGAFQGHREEADQKNRAWAFDATTIDAVVLTHAHYDHCGLLPLLTARGYKGSIYSTTATANLANIVLRDSAKIQAADFAFLAKQANHGHRHLKTKPLYDEDDVYKVMQQFVTIGYERTINLTDDIKLTFYNQGHILGSASAYLTITDEGKETTMLFSGDMGRPHHPILQSPSIPPKADYAMVESTYGDRLHDSLEKSLNKLASVITKTVRRGGKIIVPSFAIDRTQEFIYYLHQLMRENRIPTIPVYLDSPMAIAATSVYKLHDECYNEEAHKAFTNRNDSPFNFKELHYIADADESKKLNNIKESCIIISANGMCEAGRILHHLANNITNSANTVLIIGYTAEDTLGRAIANHQPVVNIFGRPVELRATVEEINSFSAHGDYQEIYNYLNAMGQASLKKLFLVHGEQHQLSTFKNYLEAKKQIKEVIIVEKEKHYSISN